MVWVALTVGDDTNSISPPAGWTTVTLPPVTTNGQYVTVFYKLAGASESNSYQFTLTDDGSFGTRFFGTVLDGVDQSTPVVATGGRKFSGLTSAVMSTVSQSDTTPVDFSPNAGDMLLAFWASGSGNRTTAGNPTFSNSFGDKREWDNVGGNQLWVRAHRVYESAATGQNCTANWVGSSAGTSTVILHIAAASSGIEGTSALGVSVSADATGNIGVSGTSAIGATINASGAGAVGVSGTVAGATAVSANALGATGLSGAGAANITIAPDAAGILGVSGSAAGTVSASADSSGNIGVSGDGGLDIAITASGTGESESEIVAGEAAGNIIVTADASGVLGYTATGSAAIGVSVDAGGVIGVVGTGALAVEIAASGTAALGVFGTGAASVQVTASGIGSAVTGEEPDPARVFAVLPEFRAYSVPAESRAFVVASESRSYEVTQ